ncbi:GNAT family N-acetyltransferase [Aquibacillus salsiterrae]|uniref:GNAT family N-acetyltransferase n=1 Tax=Aquibacillus salsiterrae TaxID=2950439 RepID=UPI003A895DEA
MLKTNRLNIRKMIESDKTNLLKIFSDPVAMEFYPDTKNEEETIRWINWTINNYDKFGVGLWVVESLKTGQFLGQCGIVPQKVDGEVQMEIGYTFIRQFWGNGYATEAAVACKDYGFSVLKLPRLISLIDPLNKASIKVAKRMGMTFEKSIEKWGKTIAIYAIDNK